MYVTIKLLTNYLSEGSYASNQTENALEMASPQLASAWCTFPNLRCHRVST